LAVPELTGRLQLPRWVTPDVLIAAATFVFVVTGAALDGAQASEPNLTALAVLVLALQSVPLVWRRRAPIPVWVITGLAVTWYGAAEWPDPLLPLGAVFGLAAVFECCSRRTALCAWVVSAGGAALSMLLAGDSDGVDVWVGVVVLLLAPLLGDQQRHRTAYLREVEESAARAAEQQRKDLRAAQLAERAHLARELHDVVAHHVSMIVVQAEAAATTATVRGDDEAAEAFDAIGDTARTTLNELRTLLGVLRTESPSPAPTAPQPGLDRIDELVARVRQTGVDVDLHIEGERRPLRPAVDLSAYRIVQEGLTNVLKHSDAAWAEVTVRYDADALALAVRDDGHARDGTAAHGHGLDGLRERVELLHGTITAGARPNGGYELTVRLPADA
jgi:signal transduction histidine kinase